MPTGCVKWFDGKKGFGFIVHDDLEHDVFVHHSGILSDGFRKLRQGDRVEFELAESDRGPQAREVRVTGRAGALCDA